MTKKRSAPAKRKSAKWKGDFRCRTCGTNFEGVLVEDSLTQSDTDCPLCGPQNPKPLVDLVTMAAGEPFTGDTAPAPGKRPKPAPDASDEKKSASRTALSPSTVMSGEAWQDEKDATRVEVDGPTDDPATEQVEEE